MRLRTAVSIVAASGLVVIGARTLKADPDLNNVPPHRHWVQTASGSLVEVGPRVCDNPNLQRAFDQFHNNIHVVSSGIGPAAPGLHNLKGAEVQFSGC